jgi:hypothetical protein
MSEMASQSSPQTVSPGEIKYIVLKPFKYRGVMLKKDSEFIPTGAKWDAQLIAQGEFVGRIESAVPKRIRRKVG